jgi:hypothetical protein
MVDDRAARDAQDAIRARLAAEAAPTKAALRELAQRGRSKEVRTGAAATLRRLPTTGGSEPQAPRRPALSAEAIKQMHDVVREIAQNNE